MLVYCESMSWCTSGEIIHPEGDSTQKSSISIVAFSARLGKEMLGEDVSCSSIESLLFHWNVIQRSIALL